MGKQAFRCRGVCFSFFYNGNSKIFGSLKIDILHLIIDTLTGIICDRVSSNSSNQGKGEKK